MTRRGSLESDSIHNLLRDLREWPDGIHAVDLRSVVEGEDAKNIKVCLRVAEAFGIGAEPVARLLVVYGLERLADVFSDILADCMDGRHDKLSDLMESSDPAAALESRARGRLGGGRLNEPFD